MSSKNHRFNPEIAVRFGIIAAIIIHHLWFWTIQNIKNRKNYYDGAYWTYDSIRTMTEHFPYLTEKQVRSAMDKLVTNGIVQTGNYNKTKYDRTLWYALTAEGISILQQCYMDMSLKANASIPNGTSIPNVRPNSATDCEADVDVHVDTDVAVDAVAIAENVVAHLNAKTGASFRVTSQIRTLIGDHLTDGYNQDDFMSVIDGMVSAWGHSDKMKANLRPSTLFGSKFDEYLNVAHNQATEPANSGSFDTNDFYAAALERSFGPEMAKEIMDSQKGS